MITFEQFLTELRIKDKPFTFKDIIKVKDKKHLKQLIEDKADMRELDVSEVTDMDYLFNNIKEFNNKSNWDISGWDFSKVTDMRSMFSHCTSLTSIYLSHTNNVKDMSWMFNGCTSLKSVSIPNTDNVVDMSAMFIDCTNLKSVSIANTDNVEGMLSIFKGCKNLYQDLSHFKETTNPKHKQYGQWDMFKGCTKMFKNPAYFPKGYLK